MFADFTVPSKIEVDAAFRARYEKRFPRLEFDAERTNRPVESFCGKRDIPFLDLRQELLAAVEAGSGSLHHGITDRHWNRDGHRVATEALIEFLDEHGLIPERASTLVRDGVQGSG